MGATGILPVPAPLISSLLKIFSEQLFAGIITMLRKQSPMSANRIYRAGKKISLALVLGLTIISYPIKVEAKSTLSISHFPPAPPKTPPTGGTTAGGGGF